MRRRALGTSAFAVWVALSGCGRTRLDPPEADPGDASHQPSSPSTGSTGAVAPDPAAVGSKDPIDATVGGAGEMTAAAGGPSSAGGETDESAGADGEGGEPPCAPEDCPAWTQVAGSLPPSYIYAIAAAPSEVGTVYAGNYSGGGVFKTTNAGESWSSASVGLEDGSVRALGVDPFDAERVLVGNQTGLYLSTNAGAKWTKLDIDSDHPDAQVISFDPYVRDRVYAVLSTEYTLGVGKTDSAVYASQDGGVSWQLLTTLQATRVSYINVGSSDSKRLFMGTYTYSPGMLESLDAGQSFHPMPGLPETTYQIVADPSTGVLCGVVGSGISRSTDGGQSWTIEPLKSQSTITLGPAGVFYVAGNAGVHRSVGCTNWTRVDTQPGYSAVVDASGAVYLAAVGGAAQGVRHSADGVSGWVNVNQGLANGDVPGLALDPSVPDGFFASVSYREIIHTLDGATTFEPATGDIGHAGTTAFPDTLVYAEGTLFGFSTQTYGRLFQSADHGQSWSATLPALPNQHYSGLMALLPGPDFATDNVFYLGTRNSENPAVGFAVSTDGGATLTPHGQSNFNTQRMIVDEAHQGWIWAIGAPTGQTYGGKDEAVYLSQDLGQTWAPQALPLQGDYSALAAAKTPTGEAVYVVAEGQGVLRSDDAGQSWTIQSEPPGPLVSAFAVDPSDADIVYLAASPKWQITSLGERGLYKSRDGGKTWSHADRGMVPGVVKSILVNPSDPQIVYAGMASGGLYKTTSGGE